MERERITISIKREVLAKIDTVIDGVSIRNRSHAFESLSLKALGQTGTKKAVILMGGQDALDNLPASREILTQLQTSNFSKVFIAVGFLADKIKKELGFGEEYEIDLRYAEKGEGSAGAIKALSQEIDQTLIVYNTKQIPQISPDTMLAYHRKHGLPATVYTDNLESKEGIYVFEPSVIARIPSGFAMVEDELISELIRTQDVVFFPLTSPDQNA